MCNSPVVPKTTCWYHFEQNTVGSDELSSCYVRVGPTRCFQSNLLEKIWKEKSSFMICWGGFEEGFLKYKSKPPNKMDDKNFYISFGFLNENLTLNEIEELKKFPFQQLHSVKTQIC